MLKWYANDRLALSVTQPVEQRILSSTLKWTWVNFPQSHLTRLDPSDAVPNPTNDRRYHYCSLLYPKPDLRGGGGYEFNPPRNVEKKYFWQCKIARTAKCQTGILCLHYCDARKSHLASIKCKKPLGRPGRRPGPRWESLQRSPGPIADGEGAGCPLPNNPTTALGLSGLACLCPLIFKPPPN